MKNLLILCLFLFMPITIFGQQLSIGPVFGMNESGRWGRSILADSIAIVIDDKTRRDPAYGLFIDYEHNNWLSLYSQISYGPNSTGFLLFNVNDTRAFGRPVLKAEGILHRMLDFSLLPSIRIPVFRDFEFNLMFGGSFIFQFNDRASFTHYNGRHPGLAEASNNLHTIINPFYINPAYGFSVTYKRFAISCRYQRNRGNYFTDEVTIYGVDYPAYFQFENWLFMLRYDLVKIDLSKDKVN
jgi:hypothetical protein